MLFIDFLRIEDEKLSAQLRERRNEIGRLTQEAGNIESEKESASHEIRALEAQRRLLESHNNQRRRYLQEREPDVHKSLEWLEQNRHLFQNRPIFGPMLLEVGFLLIQ